MPLGIEPNVLWSGAIGSLVAALIGGLVALGVVRLTNKNQARLAGEAREKAAIADFIASADGFLTEYSEGRRAIESLLQQTMAASVRWQLELSDEDMASELILWPHHLVNLAVKASEAEADGGDPADEYEALLQAVMEVRFAALEWHKANQGQRNEYRRRLEAGRTAGSGNAAGPPSTS
ncbi:hypothetical protein NNX28_16880 [Arthrobacter sp. zg-Y859]|uniref:DUF4760 domain-containing protein n=1 Tax=Arthrobacter jinronghuae TaxID=2964609 RepID=A0ABT1NYJ6_9MICC|nr:hypothetical protein [Arthrobacter jinronghuae]MCQ1951594.1 hypothetical protein [Arthrobacter jinronghuae]UWX79691.1 hypothetical protein N2K98_05700 [Arthrobacter jinronghuae]